MCRAMSHRSLSVATSDCRLMRRGHECGRHMDVAHNSVPRLLGHFCPSPWRTDAEPSRDPLIEFECYSRAREADRHVKRLYGSPAREAPCQRYPRSLRLDLPIEGDGAATPPHSFLRRCPPRSTPRNLVHEPEITPRMDKATRSVGRVACRG